LVGWFRKTLWVPRFGRNLQETGILLEVIIGDSYSITFGDGLVTVKPSPLTSNLSLLMSHHQKYQRIER
jgi:hypothetical protein